MAVDKIKTHAGLEDALKDARAAGRVIGFTNGCFDILHLGHIRYLQEARSACDILVVGVNSDASVKRLKGPSRPVSPEQARLEVLAALECVDLLTLFDEDTPQTLIESLTPDVLFKGGDWEEKDIAGAAHVRSRGGKVSIIRFVEGYSTTGLIENMREPRRGCDG